MMCDYERSNMSTGSSGIYKIRAYDSYGIAVNIEVSSETAVSELKRLIQSRFNQSTFENNVKANLNLYSKNLTKSNSPSVNAPFKLSSAFLFPCYCQKSENNITKLVSVRLNRQLQEQRSIKDEGLQNGDILIYLPKLFAVNQDIQSNHKDDAFSFESIADATKHLVPKNTDHQVTKHIHSVTKLKNNVMLASVTLIDFLATILEHHKDLQHFFHDVNQAMKQKHNAVASQPNSDAKVVEDEQFKQLLEMGFEHSKIVHAYQVRQVKQIDPMEFLLKSNDSNNNDDCERDDLPADDQCDQKCSVIDSNAYYPRVPILVNCYRKYQRKIFKVNQKSFNKIKQMGVEEVRVLDALWIHNNNENAACEWLLSERRPNDSVLSLGVNRNSPLYKALMSDEKILLLLNKPKILFGFLHEIEDPIADSTCMFDSQLLQIVTRIVQLIETHPDQGVQ